MDSNPQDGARWRWTRSDAPTLLKSEDSKDASAMSRLLAMIDEYKDAHGQPSDASVARQLGIAPQTLSSWRRRGLKELPKDPETLHNLAKVLGKPIEDVWYAAGVDVGVIVETVVTDEDLVRRRVEEWRAATTEGIPDADTGSA